VTAGCAHVCSSNPHSAALRGMVGKGLVAGDVCFRMQERQQQFWPMNVGTYAGQAQQSAQQPTGPLGSVFGVLGPFPPEVVKRQSSQSTQLRGIGCPVGVLVLMHQSSLLRLPERHIIPVQQCMLHSSADLAGHGGPRHKCGVTAGGWGRCCKPSGVLWVAKPKGP
jgi:hypothetical protein